MKDLEVWPKKMGCKPEIRWGPDGIFDSHPSHVNWPALVNEYSKPCSLVITFDVGLNYRMCTTCLVCFLFIISVSQSCTMGILFFSQYFSLNPSPGFEHCSDPAASHESRTMPVRGDPVATQELLVYLVCLTKATVTAKATTSPAIPLPNND